MTWTEAGKWCTDPTHDYIWGDDAETMIKNAKAHMEEFHPYEWGKMTSDHVESMDAKISAHFPGVDAEAA